MFSRIIRETFLVSLIIFFIFSNLHFPKNEVVNAETRYYLEIINRKNNNILVKIEVSVGDKFYLEYINSRD
ncbi:hypothetical protein CVT91_15605, partial [Candidatus Atribacteria bacterium HGW-Atribacteria-1]